VSDEKRAQEVEQRGVRVGGVGLETLRQKAQEAMSKGSAFA